MTTTSCDDVLREQMVEALAYWDATHPTPTERDQEEVVDALLPVVRRAQDAPQRLDRVRRVYEEHLVLGDHGYVYDDPEAALDAIWDVLNGAQSRPAAAQGHPSHAL